MSASAQEELRTKLRRLLIDTVSIDVYLPLKIYKNELSTICERILLKGQCDKFLNEFYSLNQDTETKKRMINLIGLWLVKILVRNQAKDKMGYNLERLIYIRERIYKGIRV